MQKRKSGQPHKGWKSAARKRMESGPTKCWKCDEAGDLKCVERYGWLCPTCCAELPAWIHQQ